MAQTQAQSSLDSFKARKTLSVGGKDYTYFDLKAAEENGLEGVSRLPFSLKVLLENLLRFEDGRTVKADDIRAMVAWVSEKTSTHEIAYRPARVLMQDFTGVPAVVDLAAMRDAATKLGASAEAINPQVPVDLVIDHSVMVDYFATEGAVQKNMDREYERNGERYEFLRWGQGAFDNFRVVPPGIGICHQVNLECLSRVVFVKDDGGELTAYPDTLVGTDSHTTMVNGLSVLGWGVGGIEAEAAMLGQPVSMVIPEVVGFKMSGRLREGVTATDLVLVVTEMLRKKGVVGKFVEFYGPGLENLSLEDQATIANMAPEYGATCGFFPIDKDTLGYLEATGREEQVALVEAYAKSQGMWRDVETPDPVFTSSLELDLADVVPSLAGPKRPQDRVALDVAAPAFKEVLQSEYGKEIGERFPVPGTNHDLGNADVVIAAITACTNTSNPSVMIGAGLLARNAVAKGLTVKPWVKTSLAPGSQVVTDYLNKAGLQDDLDKLGFTTVGYGCTTCIGNSGPLPEPISKAVNDNDLAVVSVLSGNRNFEGRINPDVKANYLASPPLVVAYAIAGTMLKDITKEPLGQDKDGNDVFLKDIWPSSAEIQELVRTSINPAMFEERYSNAFTGDERWKSIQTSEGQTYGWGDSTYVANPPYFEGMTGNADAVEDIIDARVMGLFADSITTDHISPAGAIKAASPAGRYLQENGVKPIDFNSYGARRGNHEVMMRGTFANIRIKNQMVPGVEGGVTIHQPSGEQMDIYDAAMRYQKDEVPLVVFAGKEYGTGSSRDWAAKGTRLLGVRAVVTESFERIHRSNLIGMGVLPLQFFEGASWKELGIDGTEQITIEGIADISPRARLNMLVKRADGTAREVPLLVR
ncbi:MAG: aconitate hydratase AcnA, partial [Pseudomonadota bacterium]